MVLSLCTEQVALFVLRIGRFHTIPILPESIQHLLMDLKRVGSIGEQRTLGRLLGRYPMQVFQTICFPRVLAVLLPQTITTSPSTAGGTET